MQFVCITVWLGFYTPSGWGVSLGCYASVNIGEKMKIVGLPFAIIIRHRLASVAASSPGCNGGALLELPPSPCVFQSLLVSVLRHWVRSISFPGSTLVCGVFFFQDERVQIDTQVRPGKKNVTHRCRPRKAKRTHPLLPLHFVTLPIQRSLYGGLCLELYV